MEFRILGPLEVVVRGRPLPVSRPREQRLLAALLLEAGHMVPVERLVDAVFDDRPPDTAIKQVRNCLSTLRQRFADAGAPDGLFTTGSAGYELRIRPGELDAAVFTQRMA